MNDVEIMNNVKSIKKNAEHYMREALREYALMRNHMLEMQPPICTNSIQLLREGNTIETLFLENESIRKTIELLHKEFDDVFTFYGGDMETPVIGRIRGDRERKTVDVMFRGVFARMPRTAEELFIGVNDE